MTDFKPTVTILLSEYEAMKKAMQVYKEDLERLSEITKKVYGKTAGEIFEAHDMARCNASNWGGYR